MIQPIRFPFIAADRTKSDASLMPLLPIQLASPSAEMSANGLLDMEASVNVLPYQVGLMLGFRWEEQPLSIHLDGNLASAHRKSYWFLQPSVHLHLCVWHLPGRKVTQSE